MPDHPKFQTTPDGTLLLNFGEYGREVEVAAISGDGSRTLTVRDVGSAEVWDSRTGERVGEIRPDSPLRGGEGTNPTTRPFEVFIESAALNVDGSIALLGLNDGTAGTFRVSDGSRLATLHPPDQEPAREWCVIRSVDYSPDGSLALVGFMGRSVGVWSADGSRRIAYLSANDRSRLVGRPFVRDTLVSSVSASGDNRWIFGGCVDMTAVVWDLQTGEVVFEAFDHAEEILSLFDGAHGIGWATTGGSVWRSRDGAIPQKVISSGEHWAEARFRGDRLLTRGFDAQISRWDLEGNRSALFESASEVRSRWSDKAVSVGFGPGDRYFYPESGNRLVVCAEQHSATIERDDQIVTAQFSPTGDSIAIEGWMDELQLWSVPSGELLRSLPSPGGVGAFAFSNDGELIAVGEIGHGGGRYPRKIVVYSAASGEQIHVLAEHDWQVSTLAISPDDRWLASVGNDLVLASLDRGAWFRRRNVARFEIERVTGDLRFLSDGRLVVVDEGRARIFWEGEQIAQFEIPVAFRTLWCLSDDERRIVVASTQGIVRFDLDTGRCLGASLAPVPRPEQLAADVPEIVKELRAFAAVWKTEHGSFLHQSDGPRGWTEPLRLSIGNEVVVPAADGAVVLKLGGGLSGPGITTFEGKMRAGRVIGREVLLINQAGRLFRSPLS